MDSILYWNGVALDANRESHTNDAGEQAGPPLSARALAIVHLAMYDALAGATLPPLPAYLPGVPAPPPGAAVAAAVGRGRRVGRGDGGGIDLGRWRRRRGHDERAPFRVRGKHAVIANCVEHRRRHRRREPAQQRQGIEVDRGGADNRSVLPARSDVILPLAPTSAATPSW